MVVAVRAIDNPMWDGISLHVAAKDHTGLTTGFLDTDKLEFTKPEAVGSGPLVVPRDYIQELVNDLWRMGFRPDDWQDTEGVYRAQQEHIADLRRSHEKMLAMMEANVVLMLREE